MGQDVCVYDASDQEVDGEEKKHGVGLASFYLIHHEGRNYCNQSSAGHARQAHVFFPSRCAQLGRIRPHYRCNSSPNNKHKQTYRCKTKSLILEIRGNPKNQIKKQSPNSRNGEYIVAGKAIDEDNPYQSSGKLNCILQYDGLAPQRTLLVNWYFAGVDYQEGDTAELSQQGHMEPAHIQRVIDGIELRRDTPPYLLLQLCHPHFQVFWSEQIGQSLLGLSILLLSDKFHWTLREQIAKHESLYSRKENRYKENKYVASIGVSKVSDYISHQVAKKDPQDTHSRVKGPAEFPQLLGEVILYQIHRQRHILGREEPQQTSAGDEDGKEGDHLDSCDHHSTNAQVVVLLLGSQPAEMPVQDAADHAAHREGSVEEGLSSGFVDGDVVVGEEKVEVCCPYDGEGVAVEERSQADEEDQKPGTFILRNINFFAGFDCKN